jgi:hypothetical protein
MYDESGEKHNTPHFHASYQGNEASFDFDGNIIVGKFPDKQRHLVKAWALLHGDELMADWELLMENSDFFKIEPLR